MEELTVEQVKTMNIADLINKFATTIENIGFHKGSGAHVTADEPVACNFQLLRSELHERYRLISTGEEDEIQISVAKQLTENLEPISSPKFKIKPWEITKAIINLIKNKNVTMTKKQIDQIEAFIFQYCTCNATIDRSLVLEIATYINSCN